MDIDLEMLSRLLAIPLSMAIDPFAPLVVLGICLRAGLITDPTLLRPEFSGFQDPVFLTLVSTFYVLHVLADKIPPVAHLMDLVGLAVKPLAGAFVGLWMAGAVSATGELHWTAVAVVLFGAAPLAFGLQLARAKVRLAASTVSLGALHPAGSTIENLVAIPIAVLAVLRPELALLLIALIVIPTLWIGLTLIKFAMKGVRRVRGRPAVQL